MCVNKFSELIQAIDAKGHSEKVLVINETDSEGCEFLYKLPFLSENRQINEKRVNGIIEALIQGVYMPPIEVQVNNYNDKVTYGVMEGNHRLAAVKRCIENKFPFTLRVHIYRSNDSIIEITRTINNNQKRWTGGDKLYSFCKEGNENYLTLLSFLQKHEDAFLKGHKNGIPEYNITIALAALANERKFESLIQTFNSGILKLKEHHLTTASEIVRELQELSEIWGKPNCFIKKTMIMEYRKNWRTNRFSPDATTSFVKIRNKFKKKAGSIPLPKDSKDACHTFFAEILN